MLFALVELSAFVLFLWSGRQQWFFLDEWDFLATRHATNLDDLLRPHWEHWVTIPVLVYRALWTVFGLRTYVPYQVVAISFHLAVAALLRVIMRRSGVGPWLATLAAATIALFGSGQENIVWGFQIAFTGALGFGLVHLLLTDHDGPIGRRDWWGLGAGLAAMMCSLPGVLMVVIVGIAAALRRGWKVACVHTIPLFAIYGLWAVRWSERRPETPSEPPAITTLASFVGKGIATTFADIGQVAGTGLLLAGVLVVGLVVSARGVPVRDWCRRASAPVALLIGTVLFMLVTGIGRSNAYGADHAVTGRYLYMTAAMVVPALAFALHAVVTRWRFLAPFVAFVLVIGMVGNVSVAASHASVHLAEREFVLTIPTVPAASHVPDDTLAGVDANLFLTVGFLRRGVAEGKIPPPEVQDPALVARATQTLSFLPSDTVPPGLTCRAINERLDAHLVRGDALRFTVNSQLLSVDDAAGTTTPLTFLTIAGPLTAVVRADDVHVTTAARPAPNSLFVCQ